MVTDWTIVMVLIVSILTKGARLVLKNFQQSRNGCVQHPEIEDRGSCCICLVLVPVVVMVGTDVVLSLVWCRRDWILEVCDVGFNSVGVDSHFLPVMASCTLQGLTNLMIQ